MTARLIGQKNSPGNREIRLDGFPVVLGRDPDADVRLRDAKISRRHCEINRLDGELVVRDLGSTNGTFVNGIRIDRAVLSPGDRLALGRSKFEVAGEGSRIVGQSL